MPTISRWLAPGRTPCRIRCHSCLRRQRCRPHAPTAPAAGPEVHHASPEVLPPHPRLPARPAQPLHHQWHHRLSGTAGDIAHRRELAGRLCGLARHRRRHRRHAAGRGRTTPGQAAHDDAALHRRCARVLHRPAAQRPAPGTGHLPHVLLVPGLPGHGLGQAGHSGGHGHDVHGHLLHRQPPARGRKCGPSEHALFQYRRRSLRHLGHAGQPGAQRPLPRAGHG